MISMQAGSAAPGAPATTSSSTASRFRATPTVQGSTSLLAEIPSPSMSPSVPPVVFSPSASTVALSPFASPPTMRTTVAPNFAPSVSETALSPSVVSTASQAGSPTRISIALSPVVSKSTPANASAASSAAPAVPPKVSSSPGLRSSLLSFCAAPPQSWQSKSASVAVSTPTIETNLIPATTSTPAAGPTLAPAASAPSFTTPVSSLTDPAKESAMPEPRHLDTFSPAKKMFSARSASSLQALHPVIPVTSSSPSALVLTASPTVLPATSSSFSPLIREIVYPAPRVTRLQPASSPSSISLFATAASAHWRAAEQSARPEPTREIVYPAHRVARLERASSAFSISPFPAGALAWSLAVERSPPTEPIQEIVYHAPRVTRLQQTASASSMSAFPAAASARSRPVEHSAPPEPLLSHAHSLAGVPTRSSSSSLTLATTNEAAKVEAKKKLEGAGKNLKIPEPKIANSRQEPKGKGMACKEALGNAESLFKSDSEAEKLTMENAVLQMKNEELVKLSSAHMVNLAQQHQEVVRNFQKTDTEEAKAEVKGFRLRNTELKKQLDDMMAFWKKENAALKKKNEDIENACADHVAPEVVKNLKRTATEKRKAELNKPSPGIAELKKQLAAKTALEKRSEVRLKILKDTALINDVMIKSLQEDNDTFRQDHKDLSILKARVEAERAAHIEVEVKNAHERNGLVKEVKYLTTELGMVRNPSLAYGNISLTLVCVFFQISLKPE